MIKINSISAINCIVKDLDKTAEFYEALGLRFGKKESGILTFYVNWFSMNFFLPDESAKNTVDNSSNGMFVYIKVDDVDEFYGFVLSKKLQPFTKPNETAAGKREFVLKDPDGYNLVFFK